MITIKHLEFLFDAEREADEVVFERLFRQHAARLEAARRGEQQAAAQAAEDRSLRQRRLW
jgi:hypothetical protein